MSINRKKITALNLAILATLAMLTTACTGFTSSKKQQRVNLTVSVASSVQDAMNDIRTLYLQEHPNIYINYNFGSSGSLQQQIEQGAPTDIFLSAAPEQMNNLQKKELLLTETRQNLLKNKVVLIVSKERDDNITFISLKEAKFRRIALGDPYVVPAGQYGKEVLTNLKLYEKIYSKLVFGKNTRQILFFVETGNVDAGLVYETDVRASQKIKIVDTASENYHSPIIYPISVVKQSKNRKEAKKFIEFLFSNKVKDIFKIYNFSLIEKLKQ